MEPNIAPEDATDGWSAEGPMPKIPTLRQIRWERRLMRLAPGLAFAGSASGPALFPLQLLKDPVDEEWDTICRRSSGAPPL